MYACCQFEICHRIYTGLYKMIVINHDWLITEPMITLELMVEMYQNAWLEIWQNLNLSHVQFVYDAEVSCKGIIMHTCLVWKWSIKHTQLGFVCMHINHSKSPHAQNSHWNTYTCALFVEYTNDGCIIRVGNNMAHQYTCDYT